MTTIIQPRLWKELVVIGFVHILHNHFLKVIDGILMPGAVTTFFKSQFLVPEGHKIL